MPFFCLRVCYWGLEVHCCCRPQDRCLRQIVGFIWAFLQRRWMCSGHEVFSSLGTSWTGGVRVRIPDGLLLLSWRTPLADRSRGLHCWSSQIVSEWLKLVLHLCWSFWGPDTGLHARLYQTPSRSLWRCGTDRAGVVDASLWWLDYWRSVLLCSGLVQNLLVFCQQFLSLCFESVENNFEHDLSGMLIRLMIQ